MKLVSVSCNHCGAPLEISEDARFVTCNFCRTRLAVERTASAIFTQKLEVIEERTEKMSENLDIIRLQNDLEQLDREWLLNRENYLVRTKNGHMEEPSVIGSVIGAVAVGIFLLFFMTHSEGAPGVFGIVLVGGMILAVFTLIANVTRANGLSSARQNYESRREQLLRQLRQAKGSR